MFARACFCIVGILVFAVFALAEDSVRFNNSLVVGLTLTEGNSETMQLNAAFLSEGRKEGLGSLRAGIEANYGESKVVEHRDEQINKRTEKNIDNAKAFAKTRKRLSRRTFAYIGGAAAYDDIARIDYRATVSPGIGWYLLETDRTELSLELGPAYIWEKVARERDHYLALRVEQRLDYRVSDTARLWQSAEYLPESDELTDNYLLNAELGAEAAMNSRIKLRMVLKSEYDSQPGPALEKNDLTLISGISVSL